MLLMVQQMRFLMIRLLMVICREEGEGTQEKEVSHMLLKEGTGDEIVSDSTSNGNGNETSRENMVVTNSGSRSTIESSRNLSLTEGGIKQLSIVNGFLENSSQCS